MIHALDHVAAPGDCPGRPPPHCFACRRGFSGLGNNRVIDIADGVIATLLLLPAVFDDGRRTAVRRFLSYRAIACAAWSRTAFISGIPRYCRSLPYLHR